VLPQVDARTRVIPRHWFAPQPLAQRVLGRNSNSNPTPKEISQTRLRFTNIPEAELARFISQLDVQQQRGLQIIFGRDAVPRIQTASAVELPETLLTNSAAVKEYLKTNNIGLATGDHSGKTLPNNGALRGALIEGFNFNESTIPKDLRGARLVDGTARAANLQGVNLSDAVLINVDLSRTDLKGVNLSRATLINCNLDGVDLGGAILDCTWIENCTIANSVMKGGVIRNVIVQNSLVDNLTLHGTDEKPMIIKGLALYDSAALDLAFWGNSVVENIELHGSAAAGQMKGHVRAEEVHASADSYFAEQPPLAERSRLILPPYGTVVSRLGSGAPQAGTGSQIVLTVGDAEGKTLGYVPVLEHLAKVELGYQKSTRGSGLALSGNPQYPTARDHWQDMVDGDDLKRFGAR
jgi:hypothetical protein